MFIQFTGGGGNISICIIHCYFHFYRQAPFYQLNRRQLRSWWITYRDVVNIWSNVPISFLILAKSNSSLGRILLYCAAISLLSKRKSSRWDFFYNCRNMSCYWELGASDICISFFQTICWWCVMKEDGQHLKNSTRTLLLEFYGP